MVIDELNLYYYNLILSVGMGRQKHFMLPGSFSSILDCLLAFGPLPCEDRF
jgi:hypothetical protein